ncbi:MAG: hypothetical protein V1725_04800 [archaeon]
MGDIGIYRWWQMMQNHKDRGHHVLKDLVNDTADSEIVRYLKEQRMKSLEQNKRIRSVDELSYYGLGT